MGPRRQVAAEAGMELQDDCQAETGTLHFIAAKHRAIGCWVSNAKLQMVEQSMITYKGGGETRQLKLHSGEITACSFVQGTTVERNVVGSAW